MNEIIGRDNELEQMEEVLKANNSLAVWGPAGIGKTTFVKKFVNQQLKLGADQNIIHWFSFKNRFSLCGFSSFLEKIGTKMAGEYYHQLPDEDKEETVIKTLCQNSALVVLDNFETLSAHNTNGTKSYWDEADERKLLSFITKLEGKEANLIIITSRPSDLDSLGSSVTTLKLTGMTREDQEELAKSIFGEIGIDSPPPEDLEPLLAKLDGNPLAFRLVLPHLQEVDPGRLESDVTDLLKDHKDKKIMAALMEFSFRRLEEKDRNRLRVLAMFNERVSLAILKSLSSQGLFINLFGSVTDLDWAETLTKAAHLGMLEEIQLNSYIFEIPSLFSALLQKQLAGGISPPELKMLTGLWVKVYVAVSRQFLQHLCTCQGEGAAVKAALVEESNLHKGFRLAVQAAKAAHAPESWNLVGVFYRYLKTVLEIQNWSEENRHLRKIILDAIGGGADHAKEVGAVGLWHMVITEELSAAIAEKRLNKAEEILEEMAGYYDSCPQSPENDQKKLFCSYQRGVVALEKQEWLKAAREFQKAYAGFLDINNEHQAAICAHDLGMVLAENKEWEKAEKWCKIGLELSEGFADIIGQAQATYQLGKIYEKQERFDEADDYYQQAIQIREEEGDPILLITAYAQYGRFCLRYRRWDASITNQAKALEMACKLGHGYYQDKILKNLKNTRELMDKKEGENSFEDYWLRLVKTNPPV